MLSCDYLDFFSFFLLVAQPFLDAADLDAAVGFFEAVFLIVFFLDTICIVKYFILFHYGVTKNVVNENKRKDCYPKGSFLIFLVM